MKGLLFNHQKHPRNSKEISMKKENFYTIFSSYLFKHYFSIHFISEEDMHWGIDWDLDYAGLEKNPLYYCKLRKKRAVLCCAYC